MIEAVRKLGEPIAKLTQQEQADALVMQVAGTQEGSDYVVFLNFDLNTQTFSLDLEPMTVDSSHQYFHIGTADGPSSEQWMLTGTRPDYIVSQALYALIKRLPDCEWKDRLAQVKQDFFYDTGEKQGMKARYRYVLDVKHLRSGTTMEALMEKAQGDEKKIISLVVKELNQSVEKQLEVKTKDVALWVLSVNGEFPQRSDQYRQLAWQLKEAAFERAKNGKCFLCNERTAVTDDTSKLKFKSYITDKINFASGVSKDFSRNFQLCRTCHRELILGEMRVMGEFAARIGRLSLYIIPEFLFDNAGELSSKWGHDAANQGRAVLDMKAAYEMDVKLLKDTRHQSQINNQFTLHFLFYIKQQNEFRVIKLIKDVSPSRLIRLQRITADLEELGKKYFKSRNEQEHSDWMTIDFGQIYWLFPLKESQGQLVEYRKLLQLYDAIFAEKPVERRVLVSKLLELAKVYRFEQTGAYQLSAPLGNNRDYAMIIGLLKGLLFLKYLEMACVLKGGESMDVSLLTVKDELKDFIQQMGYSESQTSLILLGMLINQVARKQYNHNLTSKPILDKLNYQGMNPGKLQRLSTDVFAKIKQYKALYPANEKMYADHTMLLHKNLKRWDLSDQENVFYVLSGYALGTRIMGVQKEEETIAT